MNNKKKVGLYLTGGLGNQLFQLAAALSIAGVREIEILEKPGRPRLNQDREPELFNLTISQIAKVKRIKVDGYLLGKSLGYILRSSIWPRGIEKNPFFSVATKLAATAIQSIRFKKMYFPLSISDVGYSELTFRENLAKVFNPLLVGYFQSYFWPESVKNQMKLLRIDQEGPDLKSLRLQSESLAPIVIHVRRGDYKTETSFGLPGMDYYKSGMDIIDKIYANHPVWVFSDNIDEAKEVLNWLPPERIKYIADVDKQTAASFMAMRLGCAYIIANSTFSWWGAFLSNTENPLIIAPDPWFAGQKEPTLLIPSDWLRIRH